MQNSSENQDKLKKYNLFTVGAGWLNSIKDINPKKGAAYLSCNITAIRGTSENKEYTYFNVIPYTDDVKLLIERCREFSATGKPIYIRFLISDVRPQIFTYKVGDKAGQPGVSMKARLLEITHIGMDGDIIYHEPSKYLVKPPLSEEDSPESEQYSPAA